MIKKNIKKRDLIFFFILIVFMFSIIPAIGVIPSENLNKSSLSIGENNEPKIVPLKSNIGEVTSIQNYTDYTGHAAFSLSISADGNYFAASGGSTGTFDWSNITLHNKTSPIAMWNYTVYGDASIAEISANGQFVLVRSDDNWYTHTPSDPYNRSLYLLNYTQSKNKTPMWHYINAKKLTCSSISEDGSRIVAGSIDNNVTCFDNIFSTDKKPLWMYNTTEIVNSIKISGDGNYIAVGHGTNITLLNAINGKCLWQYNTTGSDVKTVDITKDGSRIVVAFDSNITLLDSTNKIALWTYNKPIKNYPVYSAQMSSYGNSILAEGSTGFKAGGDLAALLNSTPTDPKSVCWQYPSGDDDVISLDLSSDGNYALILHDYDVHTKYNLTLLDKNPSSSKVALWTYSFGFTAGQAVSISAIGNYIVAGKGDIIMLFYHDVPIYQGGLVGGPSADDDGDAKDEDTNVIVVIVVIIVIASIVGGVSVIFVLIKKDIINISKLKR